MLGLVVGFFFVVVVVFHVFCFVFVVLLLFFLSFFVTDIRPCSNWRNSADCYSANTI